MKKRWVVILILVLVLLTLIGLGRKLSSKPRQVTTKLPKLKITIVKYPKEIDCYRKAETIVLEVKNIGQKDLKYQDIEQQKFGLGVCDGDRTDKVACFNTNDKANLIKVGDFGEIKVGETKQISLTTKALANFPKTKKNGTYKFFINFTWAKNPKLKIDISKSDPFEVKTNLMDPTNKYLRSCEK